MIFFFAVLKPVQKSLYQNRRHGCIFFAVRKTVFSQCKKNNNNNLKKNPEHHLPSVELALHCTFPVSWFQPMWGSSCTSVPLVQSDGCARPLSSVEPPPWWRVGQGRDGLCCELCWAMNGPWVGHTWTEASENKERTTVLFPLWREQGNVIHRVSE